jgi:hypothetical protein
MVADSLKNIKWEEFGTKMDSINQLISLFQDSFKQNERKELLREVKKLQKEKNKLKNRPVHE